MTQILTSADALVRLVPDGAKIAVFKDSGIPMEIARALVRRDARGLHLVTVPTSGEFADMLIGAGCVSVIETAGVSLGEFGPAHAFVRAVKAGAIEIRDSTCPAVYTGLQAAEKGIPFMPIRGLIGSDLLGVRPDYKVIGNPFADDDPIVAIPAIRPDVAVMHVPLADRFGNLWISRAHELKILAHASVLTLATAEEIVDDNLALDETRAPALIPGHSVAALAPAPNGAWPMDLPGRYAADTGHRRAYADRTRTPEGMATYLREVVFGETVAAE
ncbi:CoA transferase subunit A [Microbaculum marinisediminis]|uniref:CoA synthetase n=1 Tax=Microbaculum marinisediminis TaxID=2931392 RepID=A0AAW5R3L0_9HYPH|nr:CoA-transferase [Microbaculum sp. A6E488]MCT8973261.1 CoA synthetase [Microbaculum sp. A6E488]